MKFSSHVIHGEKHGRTIGYPTANLEVTDAVRQALDKEGVYAVKIKASSGEYKGVLFYGIRSLFKDQRQVCEILLLDFADDLYGEEITVEIVEYIRGVVVVKNEEELKELIEEDIKNVRLIIKRYKTQDTNNIQDTNSKF